MEPLFPYFGNKRNAASQVWEIFGEVSRYVEPFFGSGAVLLGNPVTPKSELVNDLSHHVANLWRSLQVDPEKVWEMATAPGSEVELAARWKYLQSWTPPDFDISLTTCDPEAAGVWLWATSVTIGDNPHLHRGDHGKGIKRLGFQGEFKAEIVKRIERVQVLCGDWKRCVTPSALRVDIFQPVGVFLDPPYGEGNGVAYEDGTGDVAREVWEWAIANGGTRGLKIIVAGYEDGRPVPEGWTAISRKGRPGFANQNNKGNDNYLREMLWCSPECFSDSLFF